MISNGALFAAIGAFCLGALIVPPQKQIIERETVRTIAAHVPATYCDDLWAATFRARSVPQTEYGIEVRQGDRGLVKREVSKNGKR